MILSQLRQSKLHSSYDMNPIFSIQRDVEFVAAVLLCTEKPDDGNSGASDPLDSGREASCGEEVAETGERREVAVGT